MFFENKINFPQIFKFISIYIMSVLYINIGINHFVNPDFFLVIVPDYLPYHLALVYISGLFEIVFGLLLIFKKTRKIAGIGLIFLLIFALPIQI